MKIMHIASNSINYPNKFVPIYSKMIDENLYNSKHDFYYIGDNSNLDGSLLKSVVSNSFFSGFKLLFKFRKYDKIIFHSIPASKVAIIISMFLFLFRNTSLVVWGGEIHHKNDNIKSIRNLIMPFFEKAFIKGCQDFITYIKTDFEFIKNNINSRAKFIDLGGFYPSNLIKNDVSKLRSEQHNNSKLNVLIGSSALSRNNHFQLIDKISLFDSSFLNVIIPLSYGDKQYAEKVKSYAIEKIGFNSVTPIFDFIPFDDYLELLKKIDIAIFDHKDQQGMGNIRYLIGIGKKVYLNKNSSSYEYLNSLGFIVFDNNEINLDVSTYRKNINLAQKLFSYELSISKQRKYFEKKL
ncbi:TDP-N-acetylfucosamine:lipid II N-acetylfucosaminyltransferase [Photobacterium damselae]|uniref:TDP-N-acetylfucosamine:lipid II N-acetylfucosaminyltransferase n=1 Tax=Photobacterium damselae TaxID=38293 RepID=UPI003D7EE28E